jgi:hypothetical protein
MVTKTATYAGIIVVAAAGNSNEGLDSSACSEYMGRGDSGAIPVGAGVATIAHSKASFSIKPPRNTSPFFAGSGAGPFGSDHFSQATNFIRLPARLIARLAPL